MDFQIAAQHIATIRDRLDVGETDVLRAKNRRETGTIDVTARQKAFVEIASYGAAAEIGSGEAHALLFGEGDDIEMKRQLPAVLLQVPGNN